MSDRSRTNGASVVQASEPNRAAPPSIAVLRSASLSSAAQHEIERMILEGEIKAGAKLTEAWLSERLGVSRGPIREAFRMLEEAGLVRQEKNRGVFVREIPLEEALEIFDLRAAMDELVGRRLAESITPEQMKVVRALVDRMDAAARAGDADAYHLLNLQFHDAWSNTREIGSWLACIASWSRNSRCTGAAICATKPPCRIPQPSIGRF